MKTKQKKWLIVLVSLMIAVSLLFFENLIRKKTDMTSSESIEEERTQEENDNTVHTEQNEEETEDYYEFPGDDLTDLFYSDQSENDETGSYEYETSDQAGQDSYEDENEKTDDVEKGESSEDVLID